MDPARLYPYVVPEGYVEGMQVGVDELVRPIGHRAFTMLVEDMNGVCSSVRREDLRHLSVADAYQRAIANLESLVRSQTIRLGVVEGPRGLPFAVSEGHWLSGTCLLLPKLLEVSQRALGEAELLACVPSRESLLVFRAEDAAYRSEMRVMIRKAEEGARKPISFELFRLQPGGVTEFHERS